MQTTYSSSLTNAFLRRLVEVIRLIVIVQTTRMAITVLFWVTLRPAPTSPAWVWIDLAAFLVTGAVLLAVFKPSLADLGLDWLGLSRRTRWAVIGCGVLLLLLVLTTLALDPNLLLENAKNALMIPIFEEMLFRGWIWGRLEPALPQKGRSLMSWLITSALFALWHLGYLDIYLLKAIPASPSLVLGNFLVMKVITTLVIGLVVGLPRWPSRRTFFSIFMHGLVNIFGR